MICTQQLRDRAARYRRLANIPTEGGALDDQALIELAYRLEEEAGKEDLKRQPSPTTPSR